MWIRRHVTLIYPIYPSLFAFHAQHSLEASCLQTLLVWTWRWGEYCFVYFGKPIMNVRVHGSANPSLGSYTSLLVMLHVIHWTTHIYKNCLTWTHASKQSLSLRFMICRTLRKSPEMFRIWQNSFWCIQHLYLIPMFWGSISKMNLINPKHLRTFPESTEKHGTQAQGIHRSRMRSLWTIFVNVCC